MGVRNVRNFVDPSALPFIVPIPFSVTLATSPLTVDSAVVSADRDFYGFVIRSSANGAFQFKLTDGSGEPVTLDFIDGLSPLGDAIERNLGDAGRLVPFFTPKTTKLQIIVRTTLGGPVDGIIECRGVTILG